MEEGFLLDRDKAPRVLAWIAGQVERGWFGSPKTRGRERYEVHAHRCRRCGFLEPYATAPRT
jgi:hypothetical protein